jgi:hypothetical protein
MVCLVAALSVRAAEPVVTVLPVEFQSYRVTCTIAADPDDPATIAVAERLPRELSAWIDRMLGQRWTFAAAFVTEADWSATGQLERVPFAATVAEGDVHYRIVVSRRGSRWSARLRAFEPLYEHLTPVRPVSCFDERELAGRVATGLRDLFRPRAVWERQDDQTVRMRIQAAALANPDPEQPLLSPGEVFAPHLVFRNRQQEVLKVQEFPWTYLVLGDLDDGRGVGTVVSGLNNPLGARPRGRIELVAVAVRPQWPETTVQVVARSQPPRPLPAHRLELTDVAASAGEPPPPLERLTDRDGRVTLPRGAVPQLQWLRVTSGDLLLANVPVLPGARPTAILELPDDAVRLHAEGELKVLQGDVVSVVAQRAALIASARTAAKKRQWDDANLRVRQLDALAASAAATSVASLKSRVSAIRVAALNDARAKRDRVTEKRIQRLCDDTEELIQHYLANDKVKQVKEEIAELEAALKVE